MTKKEREKELRCYPAALTAAEVAEILRVSIKTVYKLIKEKNSAGGKGRQRKPHCKIAADRLFTAKGQTKFEPKGLLS